MNSSETECDVLSVGLICADYICDPIACWPPPGHLISTPSLTLAVGGSAANIAIDAARLGLRTALLAAIGDDVLGRFLLDELHQANVQCQHVLVSSTQQTASTMVVNVADEDRRFIHARGANKLLSGNEISDAALSNCRAVCVAGLGLNPELRGQNVADLFRRAHRRQAYTLLDVVLADPDVARPEIQAALPETDFFLPNGDEARLLTGLDDLDEQAACFLDWGARHVVMTRGAGGAALYSKGSPPLRISAHPVVQIDGTGGGDAFDAGFLYALLQNKPLAECLEYGSALGASCVQSAGATTGCFDSLRLEEFVREHPLRVTTDA